MNYLVPVRDLHLAINLLLTSSSPSFPSHLDLAKETIENRSFRLPIALLTSSSSLSEFQPLRTLFPHFLLSTLTYHNKCLIDFLGKNLTTNRTTTTNSTTNWITNAVVLNEPVVLKCGERHQHEFGRSGGGQHGPSLIFEKCMLELVKQCKNVYGKLQVKDLFGFEICDGVDGSCPSWNEQEGTGTGTGMGIAEKIRVQVCELISDLPLLLDVSGSFIDIVRKDEAEADSDSDSESESAKLIQSVIESLCEVQMFQPFIMSLAFAESEAHEEGEGEGEGEKENQEKKYIGVICRYEEAVLRFLRRFAVTATPEEGGEVTGQDRGSQAATTALEKIEAVRKRLCLRRSCLLQPSAEGAARRTEADLRFSEDELFGFLREDPELLFEFVQKIWPLMLLPIPRSSSPSKKGINKSKRMDEWMVVVMRCYANQGKEEIARKEMLRFLDLEWSSDQDFARDVWIRILDVVKILCLNEVELNDFLKKIRDVVASSAVFAQVVGDVFPECAFVERESVERILSMPDLSSAQQALSSLSPSVKLEILVEGLFRLKSELSETRECASRALKAARVAESRISSIGDDPVVANLTDAVAALSKSLEGHSDSSPGLQSVRTLVDQRFEKAESRHEKRWTSFSDRHDREVRSSKALHSDLRRYVEVEVDKQQVSLAARSAASKKRMDSLEAEVNRLRHEIEPATTWGRSTPEVTPAMLETRLLELETKFDDRLRREFRSSSGSADDWIEKPREQSRRRVEIRRSRDSSAAKSVPVSSDSSTRSRRVRRSNAPRAANVQVVKSETRVSELRRPQYFDDEPDEPEAFTPFRRSSSVASSRSSRSASSSEAAPIPAPLFLMDDREAEEPEEPHGAVLVANLPPSVTHSQLQRHFDHCGHVHKIFMPHSPRDSATVVFSVASSVDSALRRTNFSNRTIRVTETDVLGVELELGDTLFVDSIPLQMDSEELKRLFVGECGPRSILSFQRNEGSAVVKFRTASLAARALTFDGVAIQKSRNRLCIYPRLAHPERLRKDDFSVLVKEISPYAKKTDVKKKFRSQTGKVLSLEFNHAKDACRIDFSSTYAVEDALAKTGTNLMKSRMTVSPYSDQEWKGLQDRRRRRRRRGRN